MFSVFSFMFWQWCTYGLVRFGVLLKIPFLLKIVQTSSQNPVLLPLATKMSPPILPLDMKIWACYDTNCRNVVTYETYKFWTTMGTSRDDACKYKANEEFTSSTEEPFCLCCSFLSERCWAGRQCSQHCLLAQTVKSLGSRESALMQRSPLRDLSGLLGLCYS